MEHAQKKAQEARALAAARSAGAPIPIGEIPGEEPDFRFETADLGIEVTELIRPPSSNFGISPVEEEAHHEELVGMAETAYYQTAGAKAVYVRIAFENTRGARRNRKEANRLAIRIADFVRQNLDRGKVAFYRPEVPEGIFFIVICTDMGKREWWCGECGGFTLSDIRQQLESRITAKNKLVPQYRANLKQGASVWLLLYTDSTVARSMSVPYGIEEWAFQFAFDRVFWFTCLEREVVEIRRAESAK